MRDYKEVIEQRYEKAEYDGNSLEKNIYSLINSVGYKGYVRLVDEARMFIRKMINESGKGLGDLFVLDIGCGIGMITRVIAELLGDPGRVVGVDYCDNSLRQFNKMNPAITCIKGDVTKRDSFIINRRADGIVLFDCLMHIRKEEDVIKSIENCVAMLNEKGLLLWHDPNVKSHYDHLDSDGEGFSKNEMDMYCEKAGLELVSSKELYKLVPFAHTNTAYYKPESGLLKTLLLEWALPTRGAINSRIYRKR